MAQLEHCIAVVTAADQGIGRAIALGLVREGAKTVIADHTGQPRKQFSIDFRVCARSWSELFQLLRSS
jgi:NAD(P)-dependent dehydrogenase (short-subunit alcohol dehydrogenase family)